jgi:fluoride exporter
MKLLLLAALGGGIGAGARHLVNVAFGRWLGPGFPWSTLAVNVIGSFLMGVLITSFALRFQGSLEARTLLATGILGGFTTFSAFSLDFANLAERGQWGLAASYAGGSVLASILALFVGLWWARAVLS